jgi:hypothetical protein
MREPRRLTTLWAFPACYRDSFTFEGLQYVVAVKYCHIMVIFYQILGKVSCFKVIFLSDDAECISHAQNMKCSVHDCACSQMPLNLIASQVNSGHNLTSSFSIRSFLTLSFHLSFRFSFYTPFHSCPVHLIVLDWVSLIISCEEEISLNINEM